MKKKKVNKKIPVDKYRIIKISKDALFEFIYEQMIDHQEIFMDVSDGTSIVCTFDINWATGEFIFLARNEYGENEHLQFPPQIDTQKLLAHMKDTTKTLYASNRYIDLSLDEMENIQEGNNINN